MAASVHARRVQSWQQVVYEELDARCDVLMNELGDCIKTFDATQQADHIERTHSADTLAQLEEAIEDAGCALTELNGKKTEIEDRIGKASELSVSYAMEAATLSTQQLEKHELIDALDTMIDTGEIDRLLFDQTHDEVGEGTQRSEAEGEQDINSRDEPEAAKDFAHTQRIKAQQRVEVHRDQLQSHRTDYNLALTHHLQGIDPEIPGWSPTWSREEFDIEYLRRGMIISGNIRIAEQAYLRSLERARDLRLSPLPDQENTFPDLSDDGASNLSRNAAGNDGRHPKVKAFCNNLPSSPPEPLSEGQNGQEWPSSSPQVSTAIHPWESMSTRGSPQTRKRIREANPDEH